MSGIGATLIRGHGRLDGARRVAVTAPGGETSALTARHAVVVCTGSRPVLPDLPGIDEARPWTNRQATDSGYVPERLAVVGAGGVGVEMATAWQGLGSQVTLLARGSGPAAPDGTLCGRTHRSRPRRGGRGRARRGIGPRAAPARRRAAIPRIGRRLRVGRQRDTFRDGPRAAHRRHRAGDHRTDARQLARRRRHLPSAGHRGRVALRGRRRQSPCPADPSGQVPGPHRRCGDRSARGGHAVGHRTVGPACHHRRPLRRATGLLHRSRSRRGRPDGATGRAARTPGAHG